MAANWARTRRRTYPVTGMLRLLTTKKRRGIGGRSNVFLSILFCFLFRVCCYVYLRFQTRRTNITWTMIHAKAEISREATRNLLKNHM